MPAGASTHKGQILKYDKICCSTARKNVLVGQ